MSPRAILLPLLFVATLATAATPIAPTAHRLKVGVVQMAPAGTIAANRDRIMAGLADAAARGARVVVFPEAALNGQGNNDPKIVDEAVAAIRRATREHQVYAMFGATTYAPEQKRDTNWMLVIGPDGRDVFRYDKIYDKRRHPMPGVFSIDGVPCSALLCADRWLRGVEEIPIQHGAQVSFELSCNFTSEWVEPLQWYWYVPRALRNNVWVVFANTSKADPASGNVLPNAARVGHGHSAVIAPDGRVVASSGTRETIVMAEFDPSEATRVEAMARATHPALRAFWAAGMKLQAGGTIDAPPVAAGKSTPTAITLAVAQVTDDVAAMTGKVREAAGRGADLVAFPAGAIDVAAVAALQTAAREHKITVVFGAEEGTAAGGRRNSAFVLGPDGSLLTRYDQVSARAPFAAGTDLAAMWFRVKGIAAVVTIGRDALWTELAELAAVAGAQLHVHLERDPAADPAATLRRRQVWANLASFQTFTAVANVVDSSIWDDLGNQEERRAEVRNLPRPDAGAVEIYSPFSANLVTHAGPGALLLVATRQVPAANLHYPRQSAQINPLMDAWYRFGAATIRTRRDPAPAKK